eukprot:g19603.t1
MRLRALLLTSAAAEAAVRQQHRRQSPEADEAARQAQLEAEAKDAAASLGSAPPVAIKTGKYGTEGAIGKVIKLLLDMKKDIAGDNDRDKRMYDQFACFCKEEGAARGKNIEDAKTRLTELTKLIGTSSSLIAEAELQIAFETKNIAGQRKKQQSLTKRMASDDAEFSKRKGENIETVNVLTKAITTLSAPRGLFLQTGAEEREKTFALVQQLTGKAVGEGTMGQATGTFLKLQTAVDLQQDTAENVNARKVYTKEMLLADQAIAEHEFIKRTQEAILAENMKLKGEYVEEYNAVKQKMDADVAFFDSLQADCDARSTFYGKQVSDAEAEMTAIDATMRESVSGVTLPILESIVKGDNDAAAVSFLQTKMTLQSRVDRVAKQIHRLPEQTKRAVLAFLTENTSAASLSATEKIVEKCEDMIKTLKQEIKDTDEAKNTCVETTHKLEMAKEEATQARVAAEDVVTATKQSIRFVDDEITKVIGDIAVNEKTKADLDTNCAQTAQTLKTQKEELVEEKAAVEAAVAKLAEAYGGDAASYNDKYDAMASEGQTKQQQATDFTDQNARRSGGAKIVTMLLMIQDNLAKNIADTVAEKEESHEKCEAEKAELTAAHKELSDLKNDKTDEKVQLSKDLTEQKRDLEDKEGREEDAQEEYAWTRLCGDPHPLRSKHLPAGHLSHRWSGHKELEDYGNCAQKIEVYNNAMLAKQTDIDAIEEVIQFLQTISSDTDDHVSLVDVAGAGAEEDVDLDLAHYK